MSKLIALTQDKCTIVDDEDYEMLMAWDWYADALGYAKRTAYENGTMVGAVWMHRVIMGVPDDTNVDHRDGDPSNNQKINLRLCTHRQNMFNKKSYKNSTSKYKGVSWKTQAGKWVAQIQIDGKHHHLGYFDDQLEAARAYNTKAIELFGEFARLNDV